MRTARYIRILLNSFTAFFRDGGLMLAGSLSYFFMMAMVPFCLFLVAIFGYILGEQRELYRFFLSKLVSFFPAVTHEITEELKKIITFKSIGKLTLILYGILSFQLFSSLEAAVNVIFKVKVKRSFVLSLILSLIIVTAIISFILISFTTTSTISTLTPVKDFFPGLRIGRMAGLFIRFFIPFVLLLVTVTTLYKLLPKKKVKLNHALSGALFTAIFFEAAKHLFTFYVVHVFRLGTIYGPLSAFVIFLLWMFYSSCIFLIGAEVVHNLQVSKEK
jgi:membrane protein